MTAPRLVTASVTLLLLLAWWAAGHVFHASPLFLPSPARVLHSAWLLSTRGYAGSTIWGHAAASLGRMLAAFAFAAVLGIPVGLAMGANRLVKAAFDPIIESYWPLPPLAYLPLLIIWLGIGETSKIVLLTLAMFAPVCFAAQAGVRSCPAERIQAARSLGAGRMDVMRHVLLPSALPEIFTGLRIAIGVGWSTLVAAELVASTRGLGFMILSAANFLSTDMVFVGLAAIAVLAIASSAAIRALERVLVPWRGKS